MSHWVARLLALLAQGTPVVRMAVADVQGSAPREPGASLLFWRDGAGQLHSLGSVGGGRLEARSTEIARYLLDAPGSGQSGATPAPARRRVERFTLGASLGQCCGGVVQMYWERFDEPGQARYLLPEQTPHARAAGAAAPLRYCALDGSDAEYRLTADAAQASGLPAPAFAGRAALLRTATGAYFVERLAHDDIALWLHGAGHVGRALVHVLDQLPFCITWVDSRPELLAQAMAELPVVRRGQIQACPEEPDLACGAAPADAWHLVMTHCHDQDLRICEALLASGRFGFLGMIGSRTKAARFVHRLRNQGYAPERIARLVCPIGIDGIADKRPAAIAIAVAAQLLQHHCAAAADARSAAAQRAPAAFSS